MGDPDTIRILEGLDATDGKLLWVVFGDVPANPITGRPDTPLELRGTPWRVWGKFWLPYLRLWRAQHNIPEPPVARPRRTLPTVTKASMLQRRQQQIVIAQKTRSPSPPPEVKCWLPPLTMGPMDPPSRSSSSSSDRTISSSSSSSTNSSLKTKKAVPCKARPHMQILTKAWMKKPVPTQSLLK